MARKSTSRKVAPRMIPREQIAKEIMRIIVSRGLTQMQAAFIVNDAPSQMSLISTGKLTGVSAERLLRFLTKLGCDVEIRISKAKGATGTVRVVAR